MNKKYKVNCAVIINEKNEILLGKRAREPYKNFWGLFSGIGASKKGLVGKDAVIDEVKFDLNVDFDPKYECSFPLIDDDFSDEVIVYSGTIKGEILLNPVAVSKTAWLSYKEACKMSLAFDHNEIIKKYFKIKR